MVKDYNKKKSAHNLSEHYNTQTDPSSTVATNDRCKQWYFYTQNSFLRTGLFHDFPKFSQLKFTVPLLHTYIVMITNQTEKCLPTTHQNTTIQRTQTDPSHQQPINGIFIITGSSTYRTSSDKNSINYYHGGLKVGELGHKKGSMYAYKLSLANNRPHGIV